MKKQIDGTSLPVWLVPCEGESVRGYLIRLTSANGYPSPCWIIDLYKKNYGAYYASERFIKGMAHVSGLKNSDILTFSNYQISKISLTTRTHSHQRICPICVATNKFVDSMWEIRFSSVCPYHKILLIDTCPGCGKPLSWMRSAIDRCKCGALLSDARLEEASAIQIYYNVKMWLACGRKVPDVCLPGAPDLQLSNLSLNELCNLYSLLSRFGNHPLHLGVKARRLSDTILELQNIHDMLKSWPAGFYAYLEQCRETAKRSKDEGLQQVYGSFYRELYNDSSGISHTFIVEAFESYLQSNWVGVINRTYHRINSSFRNDYTLNTIARRMLGISPDRLNKLIELGLFKEVIRKTRLSGRKITILRKSEVERFIEEMKHMMNRYETCLYLGITDRQFDVLVERGIINPVIRSGDASIAEWWVDDRHINQLMDRIISMAPQRLNSDDAVPFPKVCQYHLTDIKLLPDFIENILSGHVQIDGLRRMGRNSGRIRFSLSSLCFKHDEIVRFRASMRSMAVNIYSIPETAVLLGLKQEVIYHLVNKGFINSHLEHLMLHRGRTIWVDDIVEFEQSYISQVELHKRMHRMSPCEIKMKIAELGIAPVVGGPSDECRQIFYRRTDFPYKWRLLK